MDIKRARASSAALQFSSDTSRDVRSALTEINGPLIYLFHDDAVNVPPELIDWFLGRTPRRLEAVTQTSDVRRQFAPLATALSMAPSALTMQPPHGHPSDPERAMICAFNLPAVVVTLGAAQWTEIRSFHKALSQDKQSAVRRSLAASIAALAKIIGPQQAANDLSPIFEAFLFDAPDVREMAVQSAGDFLQVLDADASEQHLAKILQAISITALNVPWRLRERVALQLSGYAERHARRIPDSVTAARPFYDLVHMLLKDEVAAVREAAQKAVRTKLCNSEAIADSCCRCPRCCLRLPRIQQRVITCLTFCGRTSPQVPPSVTALCMFDDSKVTKLDTDF